MRRIPTNHALKVRNRRDVVHNNINYLMQRGSIRPGQYLYRRLNADTCLIFHYSPGGFGRLVGPRSPRKRFYDWENIFKEIPPGFGRELTVDYDTALGALWRYERVGKIKRNEFRVIPVGSRKTQRVILCVQQN